MPLRFAIMDTAAHYHGAARVRAMELRDIPW